MIAPDRQQACHEARVAAAALAVLLSLLVFAPARAGDGEERDYLAERPLPLGIPEDAQPLDLGFDGVVQSMHPVWWGVEQQRAVLAVVTTWDAGRREYDLGAIAILSVDMDVLRVYPAGEELREMHGFRVPPVYLAVTEEEEIILLRQREKDMVHSYTTPELVLTSYCPGTGTSRDLRGDIRRGPHFSSWPIAGFTPPRHVLITTRGYREGEDLRGLDIDELVARRQDFILRIDLETMEEDRIPYSLRDLDPLELEAGMFISHGHLSSREPVGWFLLRRTSSPHEETMTAEERRDTMHRHFVLVFDYEEDRLVDHVPRVDGFAMALQEDAFLYAVHKTDQPQPWEPLSGAMKMLVQYPTGRVVLDSYHRLNIAGYCSVRDRIYLAPDPVRIDEWRTGEFFVRSLMDYTAGENPAHPNLYYYDF